MAAKLPVWGIDVGQCSLKALKLQLAGDQVQMLAFDVVEHPTILSQAEGEAPKLVREAIEKFASRNDLRGSQVVVSVPGQQTLTRFTKMPPVEAKKIPDMVQYEAGQQIPFDMDEVVWDYHVFTEPDSPDVEVGIFAIRKELIRNHLAQFTDHGIEPVIVQAAPMASYNAVMFDRPAGDAKAMILLDMGALATDLIVVEGSTIWSRPVPIGGNRFTEALVSTFKTSFKKAEELKRTAASTKYARQIFQAMRPVFADLVSEVQRSIGFYTSTHREAHITRILGMGNAFKLPGLQKFLSQNLSLDVEKISSFNKLSTAGFDDKPEFTDNVMSFSVAYGLALQGLGLAPVTSSLLPPEIRKHILWSRKRFWFGAAAACLAGAAASIWIANASAKSALKNGMGDIESPGITAFRSVDEAQTALPTVTNGSPLKQAVTIGRIAQTFKSEYAKVAASPTEAVKKLEDISKLPQANVMIPQILDVVHRAIQELTPEEIKKADTAEQYAELAKRKPRTERDEIWINSLRMIGYRASDAEKVFQGDAPAGPGGSRNAGWGIELKGRTTNQEPASRLDNPGNKALVQLLETLGREPKKGFYFGDVKLTEVKKGVVEDTPLDRGGPPGMNPPPAVNRPDGREGPRGNLPGFVPPNEPFGQSTGSGRLQNELAKYDYKPTVDPLTGESTSTDSDFTVLILVLTGDTPAQMIPEQYKPKDEKDKGKQTPGQPAAPGDQPKPAPPPVRRD